MMNTTTPVATHVAVHIRSYGELGDADRHDFAQLVLPLAGSLLLDIDGRTEQLDLLRGAVVAPRAWHAQGFRGANRSLIVDLDWAGVDPELGGRLLERPFRPLGPAARKLVEFMGILLDANQPDNVLAAGWPASTMMPMNSTSLRAAGPSGRNGRSSRRSPRPGSTPAQSRSTISERLAPWNPCACQARGATTAPRSRSSCLVRPSMSSSRLPASGSTSWAKS